MYVQPNEPLFGVRSGVLSAVIRPITAVSSANLMMVLESKVATQSCVYREYSRGLSRL